MAADFFERQDAARRNTTRLVVLFGLAVIGMIAAIDLLLAGLLGYLGRDSATGAIDWSQAVDPGVLTLAAVGTLLVVSGGSLGKIAQLRGGGHVVAEQLGGRRLDPGTASPAERQLLNVVDEMAIASGVPAPPVFLLDREEGINAFAAGFAPGDAVIGITRGTVERLNRDELQGVIAHEFSHILNGDMRLNIRLMGLLHGILIIGMLGYFILRMTAWSGAGSRSRRSRDGGNAMPLMAFAFGLMVVGFVGTFFGNLIKASVSRERERLADASAVQFTRQPMGIANALKKILGLAAGSTVHHPNAPEASHMFFGRATTGLNALFSTHPPLEERIRALDPSWTGGLPAGEGPPLPARAAPAGVSGFVVGAPRPARVADAVASIGQVGDAHLQQAAALIEGLPPEARRAAHEPYGARALVYALLVNESPESTQAQLARLEREADADVYAETLALLPTVARVTRDGRLPLVEMSLPALRALTPAQYARFRDNVTALVHADARISLFEWALQRGLLRDLDQAAGHRRPARVRQRSLARLLPQVDVLLSALARAGHQAPDGAERGFAAAQRRLGREGVALGAAAGSGLDALDGALDVLDEATPAIKRQVLEAAAACVAADETVTAAEADLLRAIAASLDCPIPLLLAQ